MPLPGPGLMTGTQTLAAKHDALAAFIAATLRAMDEIAADPQVGLDAAFALVPELAQDPAPSADPRRDHRHLAGPDGAVRGDRP